MIGEKAVSKVANFFQPQGKTATISAFGVRFGFSHDTYMIPYMTSTA